ncbi:MAG: hypothetical protein U5N86_12915 [Planctomycetota bacterium]|nr:hypothetical protein [Planctomycetota bacterium]
MAAAAAPNEGSGKLKCEACYGRGIRVCDACGGEGKWKTYTLLQRSFTARQFDCFDRGDEMPPHIQASASAALHNARFDFDNSFRVGMTPDLRAIEEPIRSFAKRAFEELRTYVCEETDHMYRFTIRSVPVTTIFFTFDGRHYSGYFVGDDKAFFCDEAPDPVQHQHQSTLNRAQLSLDEGDPKGAYATLMKTMEHAVAVPQISREYRKLLCAAMEEARKAFETSGFTLALVLAIVLPTWLSFTGHVFGTAASLAAVVMPVLISRVLGTRICLCPPRAGLLISVVGVLLASGLSWLMSPLYAFPLGLAAVALTGAIGTFYIFTRLTTVSPIESNILRLCMRGEERS